eukprot:TRINITY_DN1215_c0_g1_i9.p1 TRINITY_DN1215_c0_g1~~TRINITY_DN1215_c0_g1_i9.p1  ORF type:complete len:481 (+),score=53.29 TRINITY_DN1215_c0_g1_i9:215-1657(+)
MASSSSSNVAEMSHILNWVVSLRKEGTEAESDIKDRIQYEESLPAVVKLGPFDYFGYRSDNLLWCVEGYKGMEGYKAKAVTLFTGNDERAVEFYMNFRPKAVNEIKYYKARDMEMDDEEFARMMFMDGCFILVFIREVVDNMDAEAAAAAESRKKEKEDTGVVASGMKCQVAPTDSYKLGLSERLKAMVERDMILPTNQIPFAILEELMSLKSKTQSQELKSFDLSIIDRFIIHKLIKAPPYQRPRLFTLVEKLIKIPTKLKKLPESRPEGHKDDPTHLLDLLRTKLLGKPQLSRKPSSSPRIWELKRAGIRFRRSPSYQLRDVTFKSNPFSGTLWLPPIVIDNTTMYKFGNMIEYEKSAKSPDDYGIISYVCFMDTLIVDEGGVDELRSNNILINSLGSNTEVANLFHTLSRGLTPDPLAYSLVNSEIESYCKGSFRIYMATLYRTYFNTPWAIISFIAAIYLLFLSTVQTYYAVFPRK